MASERLHLLARSHENDDGADPPSSAAGPQAASPPQGPAEAPVLHSVPPVPPARLKTPVTAYLMWFPFGLLGFHHFYLRNTAIGFNYLLTMGLFGFGWLVDFWRIPMLVDAANDEIEARWIWEHEICERSTSDSIPKFEYHKPKRLSDCYILGFTTGFLGLHHHYLGRHYMGLLYLVTIGLFGIGVVSDWIRMPLHLKRYHDRLAKKLRGSGEPETYHLDDAYVLAVPGGILGFHHFYLGRYLWGFGYLFTLGVLGLGWLVDLVRMPFLVEDANHRARSRLTMLDGVETGMKYRSFDDDGGVPRVDPYYSDYNSGRSQHSLSQSESGGASAAVSSPRSSIPQQQPLAPRSVPRPQHFKEFKANEEAPPTDAPLPGHHCAPPSPPPCSTPPPQYVLKADPGSAFDEQ